MAEHDPLMCLGVWPSHRNALRTIATSSVPFSRGSDNLGRNGNLEDRTGNDRSPNPKPGRSAAVETNRDRDDQGSKPPSDERQTGRSDNPLGSSWHTTGGVQVDREVRILIEQLVARLRLRLRVVEEIGDRPVVVVDCGQSTVEDADQTGALTPESELFVFTEAATERFRRLGDPYTVGASHRYVAGPECEQDPIRVHIQGLARGFIVMGINYRRHASSLLVLGHWHVPHHDPIRRLFVCTPMAVEEVGARYNVVVNPQHDVARRGIKSGLTRRCRTSPGTRDHPHSGICAKPGAGQNLLNPIRVSIGHHDDFMRSLRQDCPHYLRENPATNRRYDHRNTERRC